MILNTKRIAVYEQVSVENGAKITDYEVRNPVEIALTASLSTGDQSKAVSAYNELKQLYAGGTPLMIKTSTDVYSNMLISGIPYDELPASYDRVVFKLNFKEVILVEAQYAPLSQDQVRNPSDASTVSTGQKQARHAKTSSETQRKTGDFAK